MKTFREFIAEATKDMAVFGRYTFRQGAMIHDMSQGNDLAHVVSHSGKLKSLGVSHPHTTDGEYGQTHRISVKNNETGETSHHAVYQSGYDTSKKKPVVSIRSFGVPRECSSEHAKALSHFLGKTI